jgi:polygalacturonase
VLIPILLIAAVSSLDTKDIQNGIDSAAGTGKPFVLPAGVHSVGTIRLRAGAHLRFAAGAVLRMPPLNADYAPIEKLGFEPFADVETSRFEHAMLFASDADGVTIDGPGRIECERNSRGGPKPISFRRCRNIKLDGFTIDRAPNYAISLIGCSRVDIGRVAITRSLSDGIDLDNTSDAVIHDVDVESHDDAICLKASLSLGEKKATRNVTVERARLKTASVFFKLGTESYGDFSKIRVKDVTMTGGVGDRHGNPGIALETVDGGKISDVVIEDVKMEGVGTPIFLRIGARKEPPGELTGVRLSRIEARGTRYASVIAGLQDAPIRNLSMEEIRVEPVGSAGMFDAKRRVQETRSAYPEPIQFGPIPASAFFFRHVAGLRLREFQYLKLAATPAVLLDQVTGGWPMCKQIDSTRGACDGTFSKKKP